MIRLWLIGRQFILTARAKHQGPDDQKEECQADSHFFHRSLDFSVLANPAMIFQRPIIATSGHKVFGRWLDHHGALFLQICVRPTSTFRFKTCAVAAC
jgi:hypothetical protein